MSSIKDEQSEHPRSQIMKEEDRINIEEATVNLSCVKKELEEFEFPENQYRIALTYENIFRDNFKEKRENIDSLIGFLDSDIIMETEMGTIKLEEVKDGDHISESIEQSCCNGCGGYYEGYYLNCSSISHVLNNVNPNTNLKSDLNTTPIDILQIREIAGRTAAFTVKAIPKGIILGPFEGMAPIEGTNGLEWKIKDNKLVNDQNANWMKYIQSVTNPFSKNLDIFQFEGLLYFQTSREIQEGEELLVCYREEQEILKSDNDDESYLVPVVKEEFPKVFACTLCCLGFHLEQCLVEDKSKCPQGDHGSSSEDFELIQCHCCKVWLEKREHLQGHMRHCHNNYKLHCDKSDSQLKSTDETNETRENRKLSTPINVDKSYLSQTELIHSKYTDEIDEENEKGYSIEKKHKCSECRFQTNRKGSLKEHLNTHNNLKQIECNVYKKGFTLKTTLKRLIKKQHLNISEGKHKCSICSYHTNYKSNLNSHSNTHNDSKPFECDICKNGFSTKSNLKKHVKNQHSNTSEQEYKCSECSYQSNYKSKLKRHSIIHSGIKSFECGVCKKKFTEKGTLKTHIRVQHSNTMEKEYKCSECSYHTNYKSSLTSHFNTHNDIKALECDICKNRFSTKSNLKKHVKNQHSNTSGKEYKCTECSYQANYKTNLSQHLKNRHSSEKEYKCSECSFQTKYKSSLISHLNTHKDIKPFECDTCKNTFSAKSNLKDHIKNRHSKTNEKEYKCSKCSYQTNRKTDLKKHLHTHKDIQPFKCDI